MSGSETVIHRGPGQTSSSTQWQFLSELSAGRADSDKDECTDNMNFSPQKKMKLRGTKDLSIAAVGKYGTLQEFSFFDKVTGGTKVCRARGSRKGADRRRGALEWVWEEGQAPAFTVEGSVGHH